ncbi:MAG: restriction endonuclease subunit S [Ruminococcus flavefaciens]|nr:restriction endonuclease subunit S [Ruminococcus flavefaciens]
MIYNLSDYNFDWETKKLSELGEFSRGKSKHRPRNDPRLFEGGGYPLVQTGEIKDANLYITSHTQEYGEFGLAQSKLWDSETLCITIAANIAETALLAYPMCFPDSVVGFRAYRGVSSEKFMYYVFDFIRRAIQNAASGSTQDNINIEYLTTLDFKVPTKRLQDKIVSVLARLDKKILLNSRINDNLQQMAKTIYDYWFTQFDFPDENGKPYRSSGGKMVWNEQLKREIPVGWTVASIIDNPLSTLIKSGVDVFDFKEYLATANVNGTSISAGNIVTYADRESRANMQPTQNSVWFAKMKNSIKHLFLNDDMKPIIDNTILSTGFCGIQCSEQSFEYIASFVANEHFEIIKDILAHGATQEAVNNDDMLSIHMVIPIDTVLLNYHNISKGIFSQISKNICENRQLTVLRDWLLPMLMNGQATVAD